MRMIVDRKANLRGSPRFYKERSSRKTAPCSRQDQPCCLGVKLSRPEK
jgi:hypothetical protein